MGQRPYESPDHTRTACSHFQAAGLERLGSPYPTLEWSKFVGVVGIMALSALMGLETYKVLTDLAVSIICKRITIEAASLAPAYGIPLEDRPPLPVKTISECAERLAVSTVREIGEGFKPNAPTHRMSSFLDLERGRPLEVEETLGYLVERARQQNVPVPTTETCYHLVSGLNRFLS